jgi:hypothetical protein
MTKHVTVPVELTDEEKHEIANKISAAARAGCTEGFGCDCRGCSRDNYCHPEDNSLALRIAYPVILSHFQAHPIISDDKKAVNYWRAVACGEMGYERRPEYVPSQINLKCGLSGPGGYLFGAEVHGCHTNPKTGTTVSLKADNGEWWSVHPRHFTVTKWRKNEADNG